MLRTKSGISQEELANYLGISRQTYNAIECKKRQMSWNIYLSLILYYDYNKKTHQMLRSIGVFPYEIIKCFNEGEDFININLNSYLDGGFDKIIDSLDEQAIRTIRMIIMAEYARCVGISDDAIVKSFSGVSLNNTENSSNDIIASKAIKEIKEKQKNAI